MGVVLIIALLRAQPRAANKTNNRSRPKPGRSSLRQPRLLYTSGYSEADLA